jgi:molybdopterin-guanine dinucleotide biosynthesis protein A
VEEGTRGGFVLAGGDSSRMRRDKALLPYAGGTLLEHVAAEVAAAAGSAVIVGHPERYGRLGLECVADRWVGRGPLGGLVTALVMSSAAWNLVVACDMPELSAAFLKELLEAAEASGGDCLVPVSKAGRLEPLCAVYHRDCLPRLRAALERGALAVREAVRGPRAVFRPIAEGSWFRNLNRPQDLQIHEALRSGG